MAKGCNFCKKAKRTFKIQLFLGLYATILVVLGQIELVKIIYKFFSQF